MDANGSSVPMDAYDYGLPETAIAQEPAEPRSAARLLDATDPSGSLRHRRVADLPALLCPGDVVVVNETRVVPARLELTKKTGARVELLLLEMVSDAGEKDQVWESLVRPLKRCPPGTVLMVPGGRIPVCVVGERIRDGSRACVTFPEGVLPAELGRVALPPYVHAPLSDPERYQTVYGRLPGSVAAPTAGLHFTEDLMADCVGAGAVIERVDLAVGLDTFRPVTADRPEDHVMHSERYQVPASVLETCSACRRDGGRVVAIGTTAVRALESAAATGTLSGRTDIFIRGEYPFRVVDVLMTNFHMPRSTLLLLVEAFCGERWRELYVCALSENYRFLSFGDAMIVARGR